MGQGKRKDLRAGRGNIGSKSNMLVQAYDRAGHWGSGSFFSDGEVGPAYNNELSADVSRMKSDLQALRQQYFALESDFQSGKIVRRNDFDIRNNAIVERIDSVEEKVDNARIVNLEIDQIYHFQVLCLTCL